MYPTTKILIDVFVRLMVVTVVSLLAAVAAALVYLPILYPTYTWEQIAFTVRYDILREIRVVNPGMLTSFIWIMLMVLWFAYYVFKFKKIFPDGNLRKRQILVEQPYTQSFMHCVSATKLIKSSVIVNQDINKGTIVIKFRPRFQSMPLFISFDLRSLSQNSTEITIHSRRIAAYLSLETPSYLKTLEDFLATKRKLYF